MKGLVVAVQFLTRLPTPRIAVTDEEFALSMRWFPAAGLILGAIVALAAWLGAHLDPWIGGLLALVMWVAVTGALHLDGLGDIADACGAVHKDRDTLLAVLADPHIGSFGVVTIGMQLAAKIVLTHALIERKLFIALVLIPLVARMGPLIWTRLLLPLHEGLAARFVDVVRPIDFAVWTIVLLAAAWLVPGLLAGPILMFLWAAWLRWRIGGLSGDGHGAGIEVVESGLMLAILGSGVAS